MPKYTLQWKDPDFCDAYTGENPRQQVGGTPTDAELAKLRELGAHEYVAVEFDTDTMQTRVVSRTLKRKR